MRSYAAENRDLVKHGGKYLLWGLCRWENGEMYAGDRSYDLASIHEGRGDERIAVFRSWFNCFGVSDPAAPRNRASVGAKPRTRPTET
jgi:hypothetical protein